MTGFGSSMAMFGIYKQMNGYFAFRSRDFFEQIYVILRTLLENGTVAAREQIELSAQMGEMKGESPWHVVDRLLLCADRVPLPDAGFRADAAGTVCGYRGWGEGEGGAAALDEIVCVPTGI